MSEEREEGRGWTKKFGLLDAIRNLVLSRKLKFWIQCRKSLVGERRQS